MINVNYCFFYFCFIFDVCFTLGKELITIIMNKIKPWRNRPLCLIRRVFTGMYSCRHYSSFPNQRSLPIVASHDVIHDAESTP